VHLDRELGLAVTKQVRKGCTIADLKQLLADDDPTGQAKAEGFALALALPNGLSKPLADATTISSEVKEVVISDPGVPEEPLHESAPEPSTDTSGNAGSQQPACNAPGSRAEDESFAEAAIVCAGHCEYRVMQAVRFKKRGTDPTSQQVIRLKGQVGSTVHTTGRIWRGPGGGEWVELDSMVEKPGWLLVEGRGFGVRGPLLQRVDPGEEPPLVLTTAIPEAEQVMRDMDSELVMRDFAISPSASVGEAKAWMATLFGCSPAELIVARPHQTADDGFNIPSDDLLSDGVILREAGFKRGDEVLYVFTGKLNDDVVKDLQSALLQGRPDESPQQSQSAGASAEGTPGAAGGAPRPPRDPKRPEKKLQARDRKARLGQRTVRDIIEDCPALREHFQTLRMDEATLQDGIKRIFRQMALECHPDKCPEDTKAATQKFQAVKAAYEAIRDRLQL